MTGRSRKTRTYGVRALRSHASRRLVEFPLVRQPSIQFAQFRLWQVHQQLREIQLRINLVPAAGAGQASQSCECATATRVADKKGILSVQHHAFHFALACRMPTAGLCRAIDHASVPVCFPLVSDAA
jgi:hypothetical protein